MTTLKISAGSWFQIIIIIIISYITSSSLRIGSSNSGLLLHTESSGRLGLCHTAVCMCWLRSWALRKRLKQSRCVWDAHSSGSRESCIRLEPRSSEGRGRGKVFGGVINYMTPLRWVVQNGWTDRNAFWDECPWNHLLEGVEIPTGRGTFEVVGRLGPMPMRGGEA